MTSSQALTKTGNTNHQAWWFKFGFILILCTGVYSVQAQSLNLSDSQISLQVTQTEQPVARILWLPSEYGLLPQEKQLAQTLSKYGFESWQVDVYEALFLSPTPSAVDKVPTEWLAEILEQAHQDGLPLFIVAANKAAQLAVRGLVSFQQTPQENLGLILINPNLYLETPTPGEPAQYWPATQHLNLPSFVLQAELSPWRWQLTELKTHLAQSGSPVFLQLLPQVRDRFYFRADALAIENDYSTGFANQLRQAMQLLTPYMTKARQSPVLTAETRAPITTTSSAKEVLQPYSGPQNRPLSLPKYAGGSLSLDDLKGQVVLLNFWASWCPPCLHEMPSMTRLKSQLNDQNFEILAVNLAEQLEDFEPFLKANPVNFPVLLDPQGQAIKDWRIMAYPTTYLIDKKGKIRYALFGGTEWDQPHHIERIQQLLDE
ncbi:MAG: TlpA family protein disulfide reductase [Thiomicrospira sp.]|uniref:TlpA disulfide reductase family protein n=1 Tax=Thiomicrospira sp. TaxID=935 RepID=UPI001A077539|nr:TlpA disulfide reductase family protein [Thiomicrospira sp.]MBE0494566.1 TlpA family protein disulfide reductase [Thiomicrospira sp.]